MKPSAITPTATLSESVRNLILDAGTLYLLHPTLIAAVIMQESDGNPFAERWEPTFYFKHLAWRGRAQLSGFVPEGTPTLSTEKLHRSMSFGYMQVLGETARSALQYRGRYLSELRDPAINIDLGARYLARCFTRAPAGEQNDRVRAALLAYNGGANKAYPDEVIARVPAHLNIFA